MKIPEHDEQELIRKFKNLLDKGVPVAMAKQTLQIYRRSYKGEISTHGLKVIHDICEERRMRKHLQNP